VGLFLIVGIIQRRIMYFPFHKTEAGCSHWPGDSSCVPWRDAHGAIIGWQSDRPKGVGRIGWIVFHGNAGYALMRTQYPFNFERLMVGSRGGSTSLNIRFRRPAGDLGQEPFIAAGMEALRPLQAADSDPSICLGESLAAAWLVNSRRALPTRSPGFFSSRLTPASLMSRRESFGFCLSAGWLRDPWDNVRTLQKYSRPFGRSDRRRG